MTGCRGEKKISLLISFFSAIGDGLDNDDRQVDILCNEMFENDPKLGAEGEIEAVLLEIEEQNIVDNLDNLEFHVYGTSDGTEDDEDSDFSFDDYDLIGSEAD